MYCRKCQSNFRSLLGSYRPTNEEKRATECFEDFKFMLLLHRDCNVLFLL